MFFSKWAIHDLFLFIFVLGTQKFYATRIVDFRGIQTGIVGVEGEHDDHLATTTALD